jgi:hypothetical protein
MVQRPFKSGTQDRSVPSTVSLHAAVGGERKSLTLCHFDSHAMS